MNDWFDLSAFDASRAEVPLIVPWPVSGNPGALLTFRDFVAWRDFILDRSVHSAIPEIVAAKYRRAQRLYMLGWIDVDLVKAGELAALAALELALKDQYGLRYTQSKRSKAPTKPKLSKVGSSQSEKKPAEERLSLSGLLKYMVEHDGLGNNSLPSLCSYGRPIATLLYGHQGSDETAKTTSLVSIRNGLAHGDPFDGLPWSGLLDVIHDLIEYAYRDRLDVVRG
ncbi:hypothetical protein DIE00_11405 [Burkholderia sp. Bp8989]|uniref:hypothetical protein n=1 Tax=Burkholderia sp. Bp8989 TaxID=2184551 RepID=UPI000F592FBF|nr:hypothetical protein [Burkholderia sp. Bp8989]RQS48537.1 hypothetical protein DIE00_11405 [Burkholderia sp. Bp8989]